MKKSSGTQLELRYQKRRDVVDAVRRGESPSVVARVFDTPMRTVFQWLAMFRQGSYDGLRDKHRAGRPRKVTAEVMRWLYDAITMGNPQQYKLEFCLWTLAIIRTMLKRKKGIELSKSGVSRLLRHLGLSPQIPVYRSYKQNPEQVEKYLNKTFPELRALAKRTGAIIYFIDEASIRSDHHRGTTWGKIGETPVVKDSGNRFGLRLVSAVSARGDMKFATFSGQMNGVRFVQFLKGLKADVGKPIIVIMDNAGYHHGKEVKNFVEASKGQITVEYLPSYAPEYNPDEQVWNFTKSQLGKFFITTREELVEKTRSIMRSLQRSPALVRSFFHLNGTKYASDVR